jgi:hypothetical protein
LLKMSEFVLEVYVNFLLKLFGVMSYCVNAGR